MNKTQTGLKRYLTTVITFLLSVLIALSIVQLPHLAAFAETTYTDFSEPDPVALSISNTQFSDGSGSYPMTPSNWTGGGVSGADVGSTVSGIVNLTASSYNEEIREEDKYKLSSYPEYKTAVPQTPFGTSAFEGTNKNVLMINTYNSETAYGYTSDTLSFAANKYYRISVYVKTGNFPEGKGATIKLTGLPEEVAIKNINTVKSLNKDAAGLPILNESNLYGFKQYTIYVATPSMTSSEVTLSLQVGDNNTDEDNQYYNPARGYAFFDNVDAEEISPNIFNHETEDVDNRDNLLIADFTDETQYITDSGDLSYLYTDGAQSAGTDIGSFGNGMTGWSTITDIDGVTGGHTSVIYDTSGSFNPDNTLGLEKRPVSPIGNISTESSILVIASRNTAGVATGFRSTDFTVLRNTYYRLSYWVNTENIQNGSGATAIIRGENGLADNNNELSVVASNLTGDATATTRYGWMEYSFYIKGSALKDYSFALELWLGQPDSLSTGIAMFDNVKIQKISSSEYASNSSSGTIVTFDPSFTDTGVTNGLFYEAGDYDEYKYPLAPSGWTMYTPDTVETTGFANNAVDSTENVVSGIISTDQSHYEANRENYNGVNNPAPDTGNMLVMSSLEQTAFAYRSPALTVAAGAKQLLSVSLKAVGVSGYGANLVLKDGNNVIATIEKITDTTNDFKTYSFYIEGGLSDKTVTVEIWLGLNDRVNNKSKLAAGTVFVNRVSYAAMGDTENYADYAKRYASYKSYGIEKLDFAAYSFNSLDMSAYDYYSSSVVKTAYNWTLSNGAADNVVYGIFDSTNLEKGNLQIPDYFTNEADAANNGVLYLRNVAPDYSKITTANSFSLAENSYYRITLNIKVDLPKTMLDDENAVGAGIQLTNTNFAFENIKDTSTVEDSITDKETFKTYTFYVKTADAVDVGLSISLGSNVYPNRNCSGRVYVNNINVLAINNVDYEAAVEDLDEDEQYIINAAFDTADEPTEEDPAETNNNIAWWLIPSILFAAALLIAVIGTAIRRFLDKRAGKKEVQITNSYDRKATLNKIHNDNVGESGDKDNKVSAVSETDDNTYDEFDDTRPAAEQKSEPKADRAVEEKVVETTEDESAEEIENAEKAEQDEPKQTADTVSEKQEAAQPAKPKSEPVTAAKPAAPQSTVGDAYNDEFED